MPALPGPLGAVALACAIALGGGAARAHDTWLRPVAAPPGADLLVLHLAGGARYPLADDSVPLARIARSGCTDAQGTRHGLTARTARDSVLELRARIDPAGAAACWLELQPARIVLTPAQVETYLHEVRAPDEVRAAWARQRQAGVPWTEAYRKSARAEAVPAAVPGGLAGLRAPAGAPLELLPVGGQALQSRTPATFQALADGRPVPALAVEFVSARSPLGVWRQTDAQGRVELALPLPGEWLLRATAFALPGADGVWHTRFATLTVQAR